MGHLAAITIPAGPDYSDNYVVGLAVDLTALGAVPHLSPEKSDLEGAPLLAVATSDAVLRLYRLASTAKPVQGVLAPALPLIELLPPVRASGDPAMRD